MVSIKRIWQYVFLEPYRWLFYWTFQFTRFNREVERRDVSMRFVPTLRLALPIFFFSYVIALIVVMLLCLVWLIPFPQLETVILLTALGTILGVVVGMVSGIALGLAIGNEVGILVGIVAGITVGLVKGVAGDNVLQSVTSTESIAFVSTLVIIGIIGFGLVIGLASGVVRGSLRDIAISVVIGLGAALLVNIIVIGPRGIVASFIVGLVAAIASGVELGVTFNYRLGLLFSIAMGIAAVIAVSSVFNLAVGIVVSITIALSYYLLIFLGLPVYLVSSFSSLKAFHASRKNPSQVFIYLHRSSLYWDEHQYFQPLPGLKSILILAAEQNVERALEEIPVVTWRGQIAVARAVLLEIAIHDLETRDGLREIAQATLQLNKVFPRQVLIDPQWETSFARVYDASREAARACSPLGWQAKHDALEAMIASLKQIYPNTSVRDPQLTTRLSEISKVWREAAQRELEALDLAPERTTYIKNPYNPGTALELHDSLFVGRNDLAKRLGEALSRRNYRPTFLLNGERRMGKSSTLKQLPDLLGARYLPIYYDLQLRGMSSSTDIFLERIAEEIAQAMNRRGLKIKNLNHEQLQEASKKNDAATYHVFEQWLKQATRILEKEDRILLLAFDEFEKLNEADQAEYLNLRLVLDWFRSIIQNFSRVALLFSGVHTFGEMGTDWSGYFVNVQTLKVSFLHPQEARNLITHPTPDFPSEHIFGEGVVEEIIRVTGCHPFFVQGVCSALMDYLNAEEHLRADTQDVQEAVHQFIDSWWDGYFRDLWERTDEQQRACLVALKQVGVGSFPTIIEHSELDEQTLHRVLETLLKRDIIRHHQGQYCMASPIIEEWVQRISYQ